MAKRVEDVPFVERTTDIINLATGTLATEKYNKWLAKSDKKVNSKSFAGKFLKVSFWISTFISLICFFAGLAMAFGPKHGEMTTAGQLQIMFFSALFIPMFFTAAIKILRSRYYGLYKLLWLFPIVLWVFIGLVLVGMVSEELLGNLFDFIEKTFNLA